MNNIANNISISRAIMSIMLAFTETYSIAFCIIYIYCGISDMLDGFIARRSKSESELGARLDSGSDSIFVIVAMIKILPTLNLTNGIILWIGFILFIKIVNAIYSYIHCKKIVLPHTIANKITGCVLFIAPFRIANTNPIIFEYIICCIATFAAVQEGQYLRTSSKADLKIN
ncbi:MAG: CDP-alcohol phosphatidyltransferase family protein [Clostridia bacterium]|nr:CDP-alcohol phosphatidyltransferase family protein [Clostridia bacterium]